jgi:virginiamycin A acetyltransferase
MLKLKWWDLPMEQINELIPVLSDPDLERVKGRIKNLAGSGEDIVSGNMIH